MRHDSLSGKKKPLSKYTVNVNEELVIEIVICQLLTHQIHETNLPRRVKTCLKSV